MERRSDTGMGIVTGISGVLRSELEKRRARPILAAFDVGAFLLNFIFARLHLVFGAYPLATAFVAATPFDVFISLAGAVAGSLSMGDGGIIHSMISVIVVFLRVVISGGKGQDKSLFGESIVLKLSVSLIGAFVASVYKLLLGGFNTNGILYSLSSCLLTALFTLIFSGLFVSDIRFSEALVGNAEVFEKTRTGKERYNFIFFGISSLILIFFISLALAPYSILGIDFDFVFAAFTALFTAKRFGAVRAMAVGFIASVAASSAYAAGFALLGLVSGLLFPLGVTYALLGGGAVLSAWSAYSGELVGFLSTLPEYAAAISIFFPFMHRISPERREGQREDIRRTASDMVSSLALSHRNKRGGGVDMLSASLSSVSALVGRFSRSEGVVRRSAIRDTLLDRVRSECRACPNYNSCLEINPAPCAEIIDDAVDLIHKNQRSEKGLDTILPAYCTHKDDMCSAMLSSYSSLMKIWHGVHSFRSVAEECGLISKMINEAKCAEDEESCLDAELSERLSAELPALGICAGVIKCYGERKKRFIVAFEDKGGDIITSTELRAMIERVSGYKLGVPEFYRKGEVAMMDCAAAPSYALDFVSRSAVAEGSSSSGDTVTSFVSDSGYFCALLSDGMGSGEEAHTVSSFVTDFFCAMQGSEVSDNTALHILNHLIREGADECSASLDLFRFDLLRGEGVFLKSGAVASYIKRDSSLFRIRSETAPLGLMKAIDSERIRVDCRVGDLIIMLSDGVADSSDYSASWLPELLSRPFSGDISVFADEILEQALRKSHTRDDMTVSVAQIRKL